MMVDTGRRGQPVIAGIRDPHDADRVPPGAETKAFSVADAPKIIEQALEGADRLFLMRPPAIADVHAKLFTVIDAAKRRGFRQIALLSLQGVQVNRNTPHHAVEKDMRSVGSPDTFLRPNFFMQNLSTTYAGPIRERGEIFVPPAGRGPRSSTRAMSAGPPRQPSPLHDITDRIFNHGLIV
jgi:uncharacterized protein YbjT (DUF2867 family)